MDEEIVKEKKNRHPPVLLNKVISLLNPENGDIVLDATLGQGGHSKEFIKRISPNGILIGIDWDEFALSSSEKELKNNQNIYLVKCNFKDFDEVLLQLKIKNVDVFFADLGLSSLQLESPERGFSFMRDGPLDMRMSDKIEKSASDIVNEFSEKQLEEIFRKYGEERFSRSIAKEIVRVRKKVKKIETTGELAEIIERVYGRRGKRIRIHPATRTFQALRIYVNSELQNLSEFLDKIPKFSKSGTTVGVISFHSLEDRIVKNTFRHWKSNRLGEILTKKPIRPDFTEIQLNPRARSAKLRAFRFQ